MTSSAAYGMAPEVAHLDGDVEDDDVCYVARLPSGPPVVLRGSAAAIWLEARDGGTVEEITQRVAETVGLPSSDIAEDVANFIDELVGLRILQPKPKG